MHTTYCLQIFKSSKLVRLNIYPDGGVARLRLFGDVQRDWENQKNDIVASFLRFAQVEVF